MNYYHMLQKYTKINEPWLFFTLTMFSKNPAVAIASATAGEEG